MRAVRPAWILPGDDVSLRLLMQLVVSPPANLVPAVQQELAALVRRSLGDPAHYLDSVDKALLMPIARRLGVDVPDGEAVAGEDDAVRVATALGYPVIVRPAYGNAGRGVARCVGETDVREAMRAIRPPMGWAPSSGHPALVQRFVTGQNHNRPALAWEGREVAGFTRMSVRHYPEPSGPGSVSRYRRVPAIAEANRRLLEALGITGFTGTQFLVEEGTGRPFLIEINRRMTPATHRVRWWASISRRRSRRARRACRGPAPPISRRTRGRPSRCFRRSGCATRRARCSTACRTTCRGTTRRSSARSSIRRACAAERRAPARTQGVQTSDGVP